MPPGRESPGYRGHVDATEPLLAGWVVETARPAAPVALTIALDGEPWLHVRADRPRPDVAAAGLGGPHCGFAVELPRHLADGREHRLELRLADGAALNLPGAKAVFVLGPVRADPIPAAGADLEAVLELLRRNDREAGFDPAFVGPANAAAFNAVSTPERGFLYYARVGSRLVGYARLDRGRGAAADIGVVALTVLEAYRRKRVGESLMRALLHAAAGEPGMREVWLSVRPDNTPAVRLYEKLGFRREPNRPAGEWVGPDEITMVWPKRR
jgi:ribosomal protein S18 acetylase RimI-like enzyme